MLKKNQQYMSNKNIFIRKANEVGDNKGVWYFLGCLISFGLGQLIGSIPLMILFFIKAPTLTGDATQMVRPEFYDIDKNIFLIIILFPFLLGFLLLWAFVKIIHKKPFKLLFTPFKKFNWKYFLGAAGIWTGILLLTEYLNFVGSPENYEWRFKPESFFFLLVISLTFLFIQTTYEELLFRSYAMQWIGKYFKSAWWPLIITSVAFGLVHSFNPEMTHFGPSLMLMYISMGFTMGIITLMSKSLEMAMGMHFANNFFSAVFINFDESALQTDSLFRMTNMEVGPEQHFLSIFTLITFIVIMKFVFKLNFNIDKNTFDESNY